MPIPNSRLVGGVRSWPGVAVGQWAAPRRTILLWGPASPTRAALLGQPWPMIGTTICVCMCVCVSVSVCLCVCVVCVCVVCVCVVDIRMCGVVVCV